MGLRLGADGFIVSYEFDSPAQGIDLRIDPDSSENHVRSQIQAFAIGLEAIADLGSEFACWGQDEGPGSFGLGPRIAELLKNGQGEGRSFPGAGLSPSQNIFPIKNGRNGLGLDGRWTSVALLGQRLKKFGPKTEFFE